MVNHHVVEKATANARIPGSALDEIVLEVGVFGADNPTSVKRVVRGGGLLKDIRGDADARPISRRHSERQVRTFEVEFVLGLRCSLIAAVLKVRVQHSGKIDRNGDS